MRSDDDLLAHVRQEAARRRRRRRTLVGAAAASLVLGLGAVAVGAVVDHRPDRVVTVDDPTTTSSTASSTTLATPPPTTAPPTTASPPTTTTLPAATTTTPMTSTTLAPIEPVSFVATGDGIAVTVTVRQDRARPGLVSLELRVRADHASHPGGSVEWKEGDTPELWGAAVGAPMDCQDMIDGAPQSADPGAGPVDQTLRLEHDYGATGPVRLSVLAVVSSCTSDSRSASGSWVVQVGS